jgi:hypothetical protein
MYGRIEGYAVYVDVQDADDASDAKQYLLEALEKNGYNVEVRDDNEFLDIMDIIVYLSKSDGTSAYVNELDNFLDSTFDAYQLKEKNSLI